MKLLTIKWCNKTNRTIYQFCFWGFYNDRLLKNDVVVFLIKMPTKKGLFCSENKARKLIQVTPQ